MSSTFVKYGNFSNWSEKISPTYIFVWIDRPNYHTTQVPTGSVAREVLIWPLILKPADSVGDKHLEKFFEFHNTDSPVKET